MRGFLNGPGVHWGAVALVFALAAVVIAVLQAQPQSI